MNPRALKKSFKGPIRFQKTFEIFAYKNLNIDLFLKIVFKTFQLKIITFEHISNLLWKKNKDTFLFNKVERPM